MSGSPKKGFSAFLRPAPPEPEPPPPAFEVAAPRPVVMAPSAPTGEGVHLQFVPPALYQPPPPAPVAPPAPADRVRTVTSTGRVRTHSANRQLPGVTFRVSEERWERMKMLSIQERRPIQDILGETMEAYMKTRGLPW